MDRVRERVPLLPGFIHGGLDFFRFLSGFRLLLGIVLLHARYVYAGIGFGQPLPVSDVPTYFAVAYFPERKSDRFQFLMSVGRSVLVLLL